MEPKKVGRALGIGVRVASHMLRERVARANAAQPGPVSSPASGVAAPVTAAIPPAPNPVRRPVAAPQPGAVAAPSKVAAARRGARAFVQALLAPFTHAGSILWLEITGLFFGMFTLFFVQSIYRVHTAWRQGPERTHLLLYCVLAVVFAWFSASSFLRAMRKSRRGIPGTRAQS